ncbi:MAG: alpha/beta fold hydrolase [Rhizobiaceae bacterium]
MPSAQLNTENGELELSYVERGEGETVLLVHGFASNKEVNWVNTGWVKLLAHSGYHVVAFDNRGHGRSTKSHFEHDYSLNQMADDALALLRHLEICKSHVMGYSLGARIAATMAGRAPEQISRLVFSGNGYNMVEGGFDSSQIRDGLLAPSMDDVSTVIGREFRKFAESTGSDLEALAACIMGARHFIPREVFESIGNQTLIAIGSEDDVAQDGGKLAKIMQNAIFREIPGRNHMNAVGDRIHKQLVLDFLMD